MFNTKKYNKPRHQRTGNGNLVRRRLEICKNQGFHRSNFNKTLSFEKNNILNLKMSQINNEKSAQDYVQNMIAWQKNNQGIKLDNGYENNIDRLSEFIIDENTFDFETQMLYNLSQAEESETNDPRVPIRKLSGSLDIRLIQESVEDLLDEYTNFLNMGLKCCNLKSHPAITILLNRNGESPSLIWNNHFSTMGMFLNNQDNQKNILQYLDKKKISMLINICLKYKISISELISLTCPIGTIHNSSNSLITFLDYLINIM